jgi:phenylglyoxylate dehydrogenase delta subunit
MKKQARRMFDQSAIPSDLCPIATELFDMPVGDWRAKRPVVIRSKCVKCGTCWAFCPTQCITEREKWFEANLKLCKGCGICAQECPQNAIVMVEEEGES